MSKIRFNEYCSYDYYFKLENRICREVFDNALAESSIRITIISETGENRAQLDEGTNTRNEGKGRRRAIQRTRKKREEWKLELRKYERDEKRLVSSAPLSGIFGIKVPRSIDERGNRDRG